MSEEVERLKMIFSSEGSEALNKALEKFLIDSPVRAELMKWRKMSEDE